MNNERWLPHCVCLSQVLRNGQSDLSFTLSHLNSQGVPTTNQPAKKEKKNKGTKMIEWDPECQVVT